MENLNQCNRMLKFNIMLTDLSGRHFIRHKLSGDEEGEDFVKKKKSFRVKFE
jgi:hypothetical protein